MNKPRKAELMAFYRYDDARWTVNDLKKIEAPPVITKPTNQIIIKKDVQGSQVGCVLLKERKKRLVLISSRHEYDAKRRQEEISHNRKRASGIGLVPVSDPQAREGTSIYKQNGTLVLEEDLFY